MTDQIVVDRADYERLENTVESQALRLTGMRETVDRMIKHYNVEEARWEDDADLLCDERRKLKGDLFIAHLGFVVASILFFVALVVA